VQLLVGLGNPGAQYTRTRHNAGFWLVDEVARHAGESFKTDRRFQVELATANFGERTLTLLKPLTFMNTSGAPIAAYLNYFRIPVQDLLIAHDELDLAPGTVRLKRGGGHGGHNGLRDVTAVLGGEFARLRIGIGHPGSAHEVVGYVLGTPDPPARTAIEAAIARALDTLPDIVAGRFERVMNLLNRRAESTPATGGAAAE